MGLTNISSGNSTLSSEVNGQLYSSVGGDFKATAENATKTITISGLNFTLEAKHVIFGSVIKIDTNGVAEELPLTTVTVSSGVITLADMSPAFISTDTVEVTLTGSKPAYLQDLEGDKTYEQNVSWNRTTTSFPILASAQTVTGTAANVGNEIPCSGYNTAYIYNTSTIGSTVNLRWKFMAKHESAGAEEIPMDDGFVTIAGTTVAVPSTAAIDYFEQTEDVDANWLVKVDLNNSVKYLQIMAYVGTNSNTPCTIDTSDIVLGY
jgi:hypothetical protein